MEQSMSCHRPVLVILMIAAVILTLLQAGLFGGATSTSVDVVAKIDNTSIHNDVAHIVRNAVAEQISTEKSDRLSKHALLLIHTDIPQLKQQFLMFVHSPEVDKYATSELLSLRINHPAITDVVVKKLGNVHHLTSGSRCVGETVYDIGANIGYMSMLFAASGVGKVVSVEPTAYHASLFAASLALNQHIAGKIHLIKAALSDKIPRPGATVCMAVADPNNAGNTQVSHTDTGCSEGMRASLITLGQLLEQHGPACALKVDVEGFEIFALRGGLKQLKDSPPKLVIYEYNTYTVRNGITNAEMAEQVAEIFFKELASAHYTMKDLHAENLSFTNEEDARMYLSPRNPPYDKNALWNTDLIFESK